MKRGWISVWMLSVAGALAAEPVPVPLEGATDGIWKVEYTEAARKTFPVAEITTPELGQEQYAVVGEVRHQGVQGKGLLEMWNHFGDRSFFSRTVEDQGPMKALTGDSDWRSFALPFHKGEQPDPDKLVINVVLEGQGTVELRNLRLVAGSGWMRELHAGAWWGPRTSGIAGAVMGVSAGLLGSLLGFCMKSPRRHGLAGGCAWLMLGVGAVSWLVLVAALATSQPGYVVWLFVVLGLVGTGVGIDALRQLRKQRTEHELRRMDAADALGA